MSSKIQKCKTCQAEIATSAKVCPHCGAKNNKPLYKKFYFWILIIIILIVVFATIGGDDSEVSNPSETTSTTSQTNTDTNTPLEYYKIIAENNETPFTISDKASAFINEHKNFFPGSSDIKGAISDFVDEEITYAHLSKNISKYGDKLISIYGEVIDIEESDDATITYIHILDEDYNNYTLYYLGTLEDIIDNTEVIAYALPLTMTTFENMQAQYTEAVLCAACYVEALY